jgi:hypothetical protein
MTDETRKTGRPKKADAERRDDRLPNIRVTATERAYVEEQAARAGLTLVEFCRRVILSRRIKAKMPEADARLVDELNAIGVNINQIAKRVNAGRDLPPDFAQTMERFDAVLRKVLADGS